MKERCNDCADAGMYCVGDPDKRDVFIDDKFATTLGKIENCLVKKNEREIFTTKPDK